jgi:hypothetical protein
MIVTVTNILQNSVLSTDIGALNPGESRSLSLPPDECYKIAENLKTMVDAGRCTVTVSSESNRLDSLEVANKTAETNATALIGSLNIRANSVDYWKRNRILSGLLVTDPTTPSSQETGAVSAVFNINITEGYGIAAGLISDQEYAGTTDVDVEQSYTAVPVLEVGQSVVLAVILRAEIGEEPGSSVNAVFGTPATTGSQVPPTDDEIKYALENDEFLTLSPEYARIALVTLNRTGDTTVTQSADNTWRDV